MPPRALIIALDALAASACVLRARTPGTPPGDADDEHEDNTFDLPNGNPLRRAFKRFARRQLRKMLGTIPEIGAPLPDRFPPIAPDWSDPMASAMTPIISAYWDEAGRTTRAKLGLDPDAWEVHDPHLHEMIRRASLKFCRSTNETTDLQLAEALDRLRGELAAGLVEQGDSIPELTRRVKGVFGRLATWRAAMIARTEASRAVHAASMQSARESGVVQGKRWLASANSCDRCLDVARQVNESHPKGLPLDQPFAREQGREDDADVPHPPLHPHCRCSITFALTDDYEQLLKAHPPGSGSTFEAGALGPEKPAPQPEPKPKPERPWKAPAKREELLKLSAGWRDGLSDPEREAIRTYVGPGYRPINAFLRTGTLPPGYEAFMGRLHSLIQGADSGLAKAGLEHTMIVFRGVEDVAALGLPDGRRVGAAIRDKGFLSTSIDKRSAAAFVRDRPGGGILRIRAAAGLPGGFVGELSDLASEKEVLFARGGTLTITRESRDRSGLLILDAELSYGERAAR